MILQCVRSAAVGGVLWVGALLPLCVPAGAETAVKPERIVSLNMCTDDLLLRLASLRRIASVSWLSRDVRNSDVADLAGQVPATQGFAEEIIPLDPDLVVAGTFTTRAAVALIKRANIPLVEFGIPANFAEIRQQIADMAVLVGETEKGQQLVDAMDARLAAVAPALGSRPRALVLNPNGATVGRGTLVGEIMERAGLHNVAAELGVDNYGLAPLESVVLNDVGILIVSASRDGPPALATEILRHPAIARLGDRVKIVTVPSRLWNCGGPAAAGAVELLRDAVIAYKREHASQ